MTDRQDGLIALGILVVAFILVFGIWSFTEADRIKAAANNNHPSHYILCPEMKSAVGVYGEVRAEGSYLRVNLTEDATSALLIGPDCLIIPNVKEDE